MVVDDAWIPASPSQWHNEPSIARGDRIRANAAAVEYPEWRSRRLQRVSFAATRKEEALTFDLLGVRSASIVRINLLSRSRLIERDKAVEQIVASGVVVVTPGVVGEEIPQWRVPNLVREKVDL